MSILVMSAVWKHAPVEQGPLLVLLALADFADDDGWCFPAVDTLAAKSRMAGRSVQRAIRAMQEAGYLQVEANAGPGGANRYRVDVAALSRSGGGDKLSPPGGGEGGDTGVTGGVTSATGGGDTGVTLTVIEPSEEPEEREGAGARDTSPEPEPAAAVTSGTGTEDDRKALTRRVKALELGPPGGKSWPGAAGSSTEWAVARFAELSPDERDRAEALRGAYLALCEAERVKPVALGVYFRDRKFEGIRPEIAERALAAGQPKPEARPFGPVWAALRMRALLAGPEIATGEDDPFAASEAIHAAMLAVSEATAAGWRARNGLALDGDGALVFPEGYAQAWRLRQQAAKGFPTVARMDARASENAAWPCSEAELALAERCEPVPIGSQVWRDWEGEFASRGWPWLPKCGARPVVYFPKGGPDGLDDFANGLEG